MPNTTAVPDLPFTMADAFSIFQDLTEAMDAVSKGHQDSEEIARLMLKKTDAIHPRFFAATQPAPSGDAVEVLREAGEVEDDGLIYELLDKYRNAVSFTKQEHIDNLLSFINRRVSLAFANGRLTTSRAATVAKDGGEVQRTPNPFPEGSPNENWRRGYEGVRHFGARDSLAAKHWKIGRDARRADDKANATPKPEASAANQQAGEVGVRKAQDLLPKLHSLFNRLRNPESIRIKSEEDSRTVGDASALCRTIINASSLAAPISEGTATRSLRDIEFDGPDDPHAPAAWNGDAPTEKQLRHVLSVATGEMCLIHEALGLDPALPIDALDMVAEIEKLKAARAGTGSAGSSIDSKPEFRTLVARHRLALDSADYDAARAAWVALVAYIDTRATNVEAAPGNAGEGVA